MSDINVKKDSYNRNWYNLDFELEGETAVILECTELNHQQAFMSPCFISYFLKQKQQLKETQEKLKVAADALEFYSCNGLADVNAGDRIDERLAQEFYVSGGLARQALDKIGERNE